jgi:hypothetical protein
VKNLLALLRKDLLVKYPSIKNELIENLGKAVTEKREVSETSDFPIGITPEENGVRLSAIKISKTSILIPTGEVIGLCDALESVQLKWGPLPSELVKIILVYLSLNAVSCLTSVNKKFYYDINEIYRERLKPGYRGSEKPLALYRECPLKRKESVQLRWDPLPSKLVKIILVYLSLDAVNDLTFVNKKFYYGINEIYLERLRPYYRGSEKPLALYRECPPKRQGFDATKHWDLECDLCFSREFGLPHLPGYKVSPLRQKLRKGEILWEAVDDDKIIEDVIFGVKFAFNSESNYLTTNKDSSEGHSIAYLKQIFGLPLKKDYLYSLSPARRKKLIPKLLELIDNKDVAGKTVKEFFIKHKDSLIEFPEIQQRYGLQPTPSTSSKPKNGWLSRLFGRK